MNTPIALVREVPDSFSNAIVHDPGPEIDVSLARAQHAEYRARLAARGYDVRRVAADETHPDCPFIEDTAVVLDHVAVVTRPGAPERRGETGPVAEALSSLRPLQRLDGPATLDGGDVMVAGRTIYVGRSTRSNEAGIAQLAEIGAEGGYTTVPVGVSHVLHLKSAVALLDAETVLVAADAVDPAAFAPMRIIERDPAEAHKASTLRLRDGTLLITAHARRTSTKLESLGFDVEPIDVSEFQAADGGLTCLSILIDR